MTKINIAEKLALFNTHWDPKIVGELNGQQVKLVKFKGEFVWHKHDHEDELFYVLDGKFTMEENLQIKVVTKYNRIYELKIHFGPNKSDLYEAAKVEIDKLYDEMVKNPTMKIEVAGHTDNVGDDKVNLNVSQKRANSIKEYLVQKGIAEKRVIAKGYGETSPLADNATEEGRTRNRRIEIRML